MAEEQQQIARCSMCKMEHFIDNFDVDRLGRRRKTCRDCKDRRERSGFMTRVRTQLVVNGLTVESLDEYKYAGGGDRCHLRYCRMSPGPTVWTTARYVTTSSSRTAISNTKSGVRSSSLLVTVA